jgi:hypothetical protein
MEALEEELEEELEELASPSTREIIQARFSYHLLHQLQIHQ